MFLSPDSCCWHFWQSKLENLLFLRCSLYRDREIRLGGGGEGVTGRAGGGASGAVGGGGGGALLFL